MRWLAFAWLLAAVALAYGLNTARNTRYDPSLHDPLTRGVVIEGLCPAPVDPVTVSTVSPYRYLPLLPGEFDLYGTAREGEIVISWDDLEAGDITGYVITRYEAGPLREILGGTLRVFVLDATHGIRQFIDDDGLQPYTRYQYRVFPVTADGFTSRSLLLEIRTLPTAVPSAPGRLDFEFYTKSMGITSYDGFLESVTGQRTLRREFGASEWDIVQDGPVGEGWRNVGPERSWTDEEVELGVRYEYAVCLINGLGVGRATLVSPQRHVATVPIGPPQGVSAIVTGGAVTLYWEPIDLSSVVGYEVERAMHDEDDMYNLRLQTGHRAENFVSQSRYLLSDIPDHRYRVRAKTVHGPGEWSPEVIVDTTVPRTEFPDWDEYWTAQEDDEPDPTVVVPVAEIPTPEVVSLTATHSEVYLVWRADGSFEGVQDRILRREVGAERQAKVYQLGKWVDVDDFDFGWTYEVSESGFTDQSDVKPGTEYEYAVQLMRGEVLGEPSAWATIRTRPLPLTPNRFPMQVYDVAATPTSEGIELTWTLPDDPTLTGIEIEATHYDDDAIGGITPNVVLPPDRTSHVFDIRTLYPSEAHVRFSVSTFNSYGRQEQSASQSRRVLETEYLHCWVGPDYVSREDYGNGIVVTFRGCEETTTQVTRHELTPDGLEVESSRPPCSWTDSPDYRFPGTLECEYIDSDVKPETWYLYEFVQTFEDGSTSTTYDEVITDRHREWMPTR